MIVKDYIKRFEKLGLGMFVHFGLYSVHGKGEWAFGLNIAPEEYEKLFYEFNPEKDWAEKLVESAKKAGCKYITLTTRHHDGFSLFDTLGLTDYDAPHSAAGRDLVREFVDACRKEDIIPFFYHTLLDWHEKSYKENFKEYLKYLRRSVEILCTEYGKIGGLWFDGMWDKWNEDWEEDSLYGTIRRHQPEAMIINNTGLSKLGALGHIELDSVTFERGKPSPINLESSPKYIASEMCEVFANHWGYAKRDYNYKSLATIIEEFCLCRRYGANMLLNVGPMGNGYLRPLDKAMIEALGEWVEIHKEALYLPRPSGIEISGKDKDFILRLDDNTYYLFAHGIPMRADENVEGRFTNPELTDKFTLGKKIKCATWLDSGEVIDGFIDGETILFSPKNQRYGEQLVVKIAKIVTED